MDVSSPTVGLISIPSTRCSPGFSLIEVLVALCITGIGLLSLSALQLQGLRSTHSAAMRTHAVAFATEMAEQVRAAQSAAVPLNSLTLDQAQLQDWLARIQMTLPEGSGRVENDSPGTSIDVSWDDHGAAQQFTLRLAP